MVVNSFEVYLCKQKRPLIFINNKYYRSGDVLKKKVVERHTFHYYPYSDIKNIRKTNYLVMNGYYLNDKTLYATIGVEDEEIGFNAQKERETKRIL